MSLLSRLLRRPTTAALIGPMVADYLAVINDRPVDAERFAADPDAPIPAQVPGPKPAPCCPQHYLSRGWNHAPYCGLRAVDERYPVAGPRADLYTDPRWTHLNRPAVTRGR